MKYKKLNYLVFFIYLISSSGSYSIERPDLNNLLIHAEKRTIGKIEFFNSKKKRESLENYKQNLTIINFWATWCAPCKKEMPSLDNLYQDKKFKNLKILAVNMEAPNPAKTKKFFEDLNIQKLEIFFDNDLNFVKEFKLRGVPTTVIINKKGEEFARIIGEVNFQDKKFLKWLSKYD